MRGRGIVLARARAECGLVVACSLLLLAGSTVLTGLLLHASLTATEAVRHRLAELPTSERVVDVTARSDEDGITAAALTDPGSDPAGAAVLDDVRRALRDLPHAVHVSARTGLIRLSGPGSTSDAGPLRLVGVAYGDLPAHADLASGQWPWDAEPDGAGTPVALHAAAAGALGVAVGDVLTGDLDGEQTSLWVTGTWVPLDESDPFFGGDPLETGGSTGPTTFGPVVPADPASLGQVTVHWRVAPNVQALDAADLPTLEGALARLTSTVRQDPRLDLPDVADPLQAHVQRLAGQSVASTSAGAVPVVVVGFVLGAALLLTAGLLTDRRAGQTRLVRARGASATQVARWSLGEGLLLALPSVLLAGPLAWAVLRLLGDGAGLVPPAGAWRVAVPAGLLGAAVVLAPGLVAARRWSVVAAAPGRRRAAARAGLEVALLALAAVAVWQLRRYSGATSSARSGELAADPVLIAAPALALLAGAVLAARAVPLLAGLVARWWARRPGAPMALAGWDVARRPAAHVPVVLLVTLCVGAGLLATGYSVTWRATQDRAAVEQVGADVQVTLPDRAARPSAAAVARTGQLQAVDGVDAVVPLLIEPTTVGTVQGELLAADTAALAAVADGIRPGLAADVRPATPADPVPGIALGDDVTRLDVDLVAGIEVGDVDPGLLELPGLGFSPGHVPEPSRRVSGTLWVQAGSGEVLGVELPELTVDAGEAGIATGTARLGLPSVAGGWRVVGLDAVSSGGGVFGNPAEVTVSLGVAGVRAAEDGGGSVAVEPGGSGGPGWRTVPLPTSNQVIEATAGEQGWPSVRLRSAPLSTGQVRARVLAGGRPAGPPPVVVTSDLVAGSALTVGAPVTVTHQGRDVPAQVAGIAPVLPGTAGTAVLADLGTLAVQTLQTGGLPATASRWWLTLAADVSVDVDGRDAVLAGVAEVAGDGQVLDRAEVARELASTPPASGVPALLAAGAVATFVLAAAGLVVALASAARRRRFELTVLRVLGLSDRQARRIAMAESAGVGLLALVAGGLVGWGVGVLTVPALVAGVAGADVPAVGVRFAPWPTVAVLAAAGVLVVVLLAGRAMVARRRATAADVRLGEDL